MTSCVAVPGNCMAFLEKGTRDCFLHWTQKSWVKMKSDYNKVENKISHCLPPPSRETSIKKKKDVHTMRPSRPRRG